MEENKRGKLIVIEGMVDTSMKDLPEFPWTHVVIEDAERLADHRQSQTKENKLFTYKVSKHLEEGYSVVLTTRDIEQLDKRFRNPDVLIKL